MTPHRSLLGPQRLSPNSPARLALARGSAEAVSTAAAAAAEAEGAEAAAVVILAARAAAASATCLPAPSAPPPPPAAAPVRPLRTAAKLLPLAWGVAAAAAVVPQLSFPLRMVSVSPRPSSGARALGTTMLLLGRLTLTMATSLRSPRWVPAVRAAPLPRRLALRPCAALSHLAGL